jgi:protein-S-isoprenylcysteine O-methyltransferase Ste14
MLVVIIYLIVVLLWVIFGLYWLSSWLYEKATHKEKPVQKRTSNGAFWVARIILIIIVIFILRTGGLGLLTNMIILYYLPLSVAGVVVVACGIGFAIWARRTLSSNWSATIVLKKGQTLTKTGPYSIVRHPIYTGMFFGAIGSFVAIGNIITLIWAVGIIIFVLNRVRVEEKLMSEKFGKEYTEYQKETKKIIPYVY